MTNDLKALRWLVPLVSVLGGLLIWDSYQTEIDEGKSAREGKLISGFESEQVNSIKYFDANRDAFDGSAEISFALTKNMEGQWVVNEPLSYPADQKSVSDLLKVIFDYQVEKTFEQIGEDKLSVFGLLNPQRSITIGFSDGRDFTLNVGDNAPVGYSVYSSLSGNAKTVYLGSQHLNTATTKTLFDFRSKSIFEKTPDNLSSVIVENSTGVFEMKYTEGRWVGVERQTSASSSGQSYELDEAEVRDMLSASQNLVSTKFSDSSQYKNVAKFPFIRITAGDSKLQCYEVKEEVVCDMGGSFAHVSNGYGKYIEKGLEDFMDRRLLKIDFDELVSVRFSDFEFTKEGSKWISVKEGKVAMSAEELKSNLIDLEYAKVKEFVSEKKVPKKNKQLNQISFEMSDGSKVVLQVFEGSSPQDDVIVKVSPNGRCGVVARDLLRPYL